MLLYNWNMKSMTCCGECEIKKKKKKKEWVQCFFTIWIWNQWLDVESVKSITSFYCPAVPELYGSLKCAFWLLTWKFCLLDDVLLVNSVLCMIADHDLVFGRCRNKEPHSSGILLCRVVVVGYEKTTLQHVHVGAGCGEEGYLIGHFRTMTSVLWPPLWVVKDDYWHSLGLLDSWHLRAICHTILPLSIRLSFEEGGRG